MGEKAHSDVDGKLEHDTTGAAGGEAAWSLAGLGKIRKLAYDLGLTHRNARFRSGRRRARGRGGHMADVPNASRYGIAQHTEDTQYLRSAHRVLYFAHYTAPPDCQWPHVLVEAPRPVSEPPG